MTEMSVLSKAVFGACVISVSVFNIGCTTTVNQPMHYVDLDNFQVDCRIKEQQIRMLQSMRAGADTRLANRVENMVNPWDRVTDPDSSYQRQAVGMGYTNWLINQHLMTLRNNCGPSQ